MVYSKTAIGSLEPVCIYNKQCAKEKQCVRLDEEIKTHNNNISYYGSVNSFKLSKINTANLENNTTTITCHKLNIFKGVVNCQNSRDKGPPEGNSARG